MQNYTTKKPFLENDLAKLLDDYNSYKNPRSTPIEGYLSPETEPAIIEAMNPVQPEIEPIIPENSIPLQNNVEQSTLPEPEPIALESIVPSMPQELEAPKLPEPVAQPKLDAATRYEKLLADYNNFIENSKQRLDSAEEAGERGRMLSGFSKGLSKISDAFANRAGITQIKTDPYQFKQDYTKDLEARLKLDADKFKAQKENIASIEKAQADSILNEINNLKLTDAKAAMDPKSPQSKAIRDALESTFPELKSNFKGNWESQSAQSFEPLYKLLNLKESSEARVAAASALAGQKATEAKEKKEAKEEKLQKEEELLTVPGFERKEGIRATPKAVEDLRNAQSTASNLFKSIDRIQQLMKKEGSAAFVGEDANALQTEYKNMLMYAKEMYGLGVLQKIDADMINKIVPDPASFDALTTKTSNVQKKYETLKNALAEDYSGRMEARGYKFTGKDIDPYTKNALQNTTTSTSLPNTVKLQSPDGEIVEVKREAVQKYIDKGAKIVN